MRSWDSFPIGSRVLLAADMRTAGRVVCHRRDTLLYSQYVTILWDDGRLYPCVHITNIEREP
jgi:hypothetical protein